MYRNYNNSRYMFAAPFLLGALVGGGTAAVLNPYRPRPMYYGPGYYPYY